MQEDMAGSRLEGRVGCKNMAVGQIRRTDVEEQHWAAVGVQSAPFAGLG